MRIVSVSLLPLFHLRGDDKSENSWPSVLGKLVEKCNYNVMQLHCFTNYLTVKVFSYIICFITFYYTARLQTGVRFSLKSDVLLYHQVHTGSF